MKSSQLIVALIVIAAVGLAVSSHLDAQSGVLKATGPVAVCNVVEILNNCERAKDLTTTLNKERGRIEGEAKKRAAVIDALTKELNENLAPGSEAYELKFTEKQRLLINREAWLKFEQAKALRTHQKLTRDMYDEVQKTVAIVAQSRGIKIVFHQLRGKLRANTINEMRAEISQRQVIFSDDTVDITASVLSSLNAAYRSKNK
ncbi:MAG: OmpH family outer membrane protein [bacterium]|nr:OmpH family outer membrane protein [bacterium]